MNKMSDASSIEWTDSTWNPVRGCRKISPGCANCYAATFAERWRGIPGHPYEQGFDLRLVPEKLLEPLRWTKSRRVFVNSMSDLFQEGVSKQFVEATFQVMAAAHWHTFQVLTKRPRRMQALTSSLAFDLSFHNNIWLGVSVEDQNFGVPRIDELRKTKAAVKFLSIEPLLEDLGALDLDGIDWVIVGGESGPHSRPIHRDWIDSIRVQCQNAGVKFFFKQWGGTNKKKHGRKLDGEFVEEFPNVQSAAPPDRQQRIVILESLREAFQESDIFRTAVVSRS